MFIVIEKFLYSTIPNAWPNSCTATHSKLMPLDPPSVKISSSSKCVSPSSGRNACANAPPGPSKLKPSP